MAAEPSPIEFSEVATDLMAPEGPMALPDGSILLVESLGGRITKVSRDGSRVTVAEPGGGPNGLGAGWDSLAVEQDGRISIAGTLGDYVGRVSPDDGALIRVPTPRGMFPTNICFGGPDRRTAYVTVRGGAGLLLTARWPVPGTPLNFHPY